MSLHIVYYIFIELKFRTMKGTTMSPLLYTIYYIFIELKLNMYSINAALNMYLSSMSSMQYLCSILLYV